MTRQTAETPRRRMRPTRLLIALATAAALALPAPAAAAQPLPDNDLAKILGGLALLGLIGVAIEKGRDDDDDTRRVVTRPAPKKHAKPDGHTWPRHGKRARPHLLPSDCLHRLERQGRERQVWGARCLERHGVRLHRLPAQCADTVWAYGRMREVYGARCLARAGWKGGHGPKPRAHGDVRQGDYRHGDYRHGDERKLGFGY